MSLCLEPSAKTNPLDLSNVMTRHGGLSGWRRCLAGGVVTHLGEGIREVLVSFVTSQSDDFQLLKCGEC